jgi:hypothetical protein
MLNVKLRSLLIVSCVLLSAQGQQLVFVFLETVHLGKFLTGLEPPLRPALLQCKLLVQ